MADLKKASGGRGTIENSGLDCNLFKAFLKYKYQMRIDKKRYKFIFFLKIRSAV